MKPLLLSAIISTALIALTSTVKAQAPESSTQAIERILDRPAHRQELSRLNLGITTLLGDQRLTDQATRQALSESQLVLAEMLSHKVGTNAGKLVNLANWLRSQAAEKHTIEDAGGTPTPQQQFTLDNQLAGQEVYLTSLLHWILTEYVQRDRESAGSIKLDSYLQLYLNFSQTIEGGYAMPNDLLLYSPQWIQARYPQLTADQKRKFVKDVNDARAERAQGPAADEEPAPQPTQQENAAYEAALQFIVSNTP